MTAHNQRRLLPTEGNAVFVELQKSTKKIKYFPFNVGLISGVFHLITNLLSLQNLLKRSSHSASRACKLPECYFYRQLSRGTPVTSASIAMVTRATRIITEMESQKKKVLDFITTKRLLDSVRYDASCVFQSLVYPKKGAHCPRNVTLFILFYMMIDKIQIVNYSKRDTPSSEAHTSVAHHSHRPENPKSRIIS
jgi:hypothetical protein